MSPRVMPDLKMSEPRSPRNMGDQMRLLKSRIGNLTNISMNSKFGESNLFPDELLFLLKNEEGNVAYMRKVIED